MANGQQATRGGGARVRVLIADDDPEIREALATLVGGDPSMTLAGVATGAAEAIALVEEREVDVAVLDVRMPGGGHRAVREIRLRSPGTHVVAFSAYGDRSAVVSMVGSGATSYLVKGTPGHRVLEAIRRAALGESVLSSEAAAPVVAELSDQLQDRERALIERERGVARVEQALEPGRIGIAYQPIVELSTGEHRGYEALARFKMEPGRPPNLWFDEAWAVGLGVELELAAVGAALAGLDFLSDGQFLSLNVSPATLASPLFEQLLPAGAHPRVVAEVTEHARVDDYEGLDRCLDGVRTAGLRLAIDDAGAGYASLRHILRLNPDIVKLDMSLTRNVHIDGRRRALVAALVPFAEEIGATVIAEGIEASDELATLRSFGVTLGQGFLLAHPAERDQEPAPRTDATGR